MWKQKNHSDKLLQSRKRFFYFLTASNDLFFWNEFAFHTYFCRKDFAAAWNNLGITLSFLRRYRESEESYITALTYRSKYPDCYYNLGVLVSLFLQKFVLLNVASLN